MESRDISRTKKRSPGALLTPTLTLEPLEGPYKVRVVLLMKCLRHCYEDLKIGLAAAWVGFIESKIGILV